MHHHLGNILSDNQLVEQVLGGNNSAFANIVQQTEGLVAQIVFKMIPNPEDRKDIAQDIYLKAFHHLKGFKFQARLSTWIGQIAYNTCLNYLEKRKLVLPDNTAEDQDAHDTALELLSTTTLQTLRNDAEQTLAQKERAAILQKAIHRLSPIHKTLISLYHQEELSYAEIGQITTLPEGTVKNYLFRARKALKDDLLLHYKKEEL